MIWFIIRHWWSNAVLWITCIRKGCCNCRKLQPQLRSNAKNLISKLKPSNSTTYPALKRVFQWLNSMPNNLSSCPVPYAMTNFLGTRGLSILEDMLWKYLKPQRLILKSQNLITKNGSIKSTTIWALALAVIYLLTDKSFRKR